MSNIIDVALDSDAAGPGPQPPVGGLNPAPTDGTPGGQLHSKLQVITWQFERNGSVSAEKENAAFMAEAAPTSRQRHPHPRLELHFQHTI